MRKANKSKVKNSVDSRAGAGITNRAGDDEWGLSFG
jgi:hypothetical protein